MKNTKLIFSIALSASVSFSPIAQAQSRGAAPVENQYANPSATNPTANQETIQTSGKKSSGNNNTGKLLGQAAMAVTAVGVATNCFSSPPKPKCPYFAAGLAASVLVTQLMSKAKKESDATVDAVSVGGASNQSGNNNYAGSADYTGTPEFNAAQEALKNLRAAGYTINEATGEVTDPKGKRYSSETFSSNSSIAAAGFSSSDIQSINLAKAQTSREIAAKAKAADGTDLFGSEIGASGKAASAGSADGGLGVGGGIPVVGSKGLGIDRDPAQVAGMSKNLGGEPIGVSADSLFDMMERRYNLLEKNGSFLVPGP